MSNRPRRRAAPTRQPFRLLDLPRELLIPIVQSYRSRISGRSDGLVIYGGERDTERYRVLRGLSLTHRDILPFAQEELFMRITIRSNERMDMLNRSIASSERCKGYAGRAESIYLGHPVDTDKLMMSGAFNPRELSCGNTISFSSLSRSGLNRGPPPMLTLILSTDHFQNLRRIDLYYPQLDEALALPNLESYATLSPPSISFNAKTAFTSINLPNLRCLTIYRDSGARNFGQLYDLLIPQLDHLSFNSRHETNLEHLLLLSTSLESLRCSYSYDRAGEGLSAVLNQIMRIDVQELCFSPKMRLRRSDNWEADFNTIAEFKKLVDGKDELKRVSLDFHFEYRKTPSEDVCARALLRWKGIKAELESICIRRGIETFAFTCYLEDRETQQNLIWKA
jgi:hypothetical protein